MDFSKVAAASPLAAAATAAAAAAAAAAQLAAEPQPQIGLRCGFCLTFTANLSKKIHEKNLKIFFKTNLFWGYEKRRFFGGRFPGNNV